MIRALWVAIVTRLLPWVSLFWVLCVVAGCSGCRIPEFVIAGQERAVELAWRGVYGMSGGAPHVAWRLQAALNCAGPPFRGFMLDSVWDDSGNARAMCVGGAYWNDARVAEVALPDGFSLWQTSLAHEWHHAALHAVCVGEEPSATVARDACDGDATHAGEGWRSGGVLERANEALRAAGL